MKQFNLSVAVTTNADVTGEQVAELLKRPNDTGLADAQATSDSGEGDLESAELATNLNISAPVATPRETSENVKHWGAYSVAGTVDTHRFDIADQQLREAKSWSLSTSAVAARRLDRGGTNLSMVSECQLPWQGSTRKQNGADDSAPFPFPCRQFRR